MKDVKSILCETCGHSGDMHSDGCDYSHTGQCYIELEDGKFCSCKEFKPMEIKTEPKGCGEIFVGEDGDKIRCVGYDLCPACTELNEQGSKNG